MKRMRMFVSTVGVLLAWAAHAGPAAPTYAVISLVGDKIDVVTYQPEVGSQLDSNSHMPLALSQDDLDTAALRAVNRSLLAAAPGAQIALLAASKPDSFEKQDRIFDGNRAALPAEIDAAVRREGAGLLVLVTKHRGDARLQVANGYVGSGKIDGLGFYMDTGMRTRERETGIQSVGYIAPFVYIDVSVVDLATSTVLRHETIMSGRVIGSSTKGQAVHPWDTLTGEQKVATLKAMLSRELERVVPSLITGATVKAE